MTATPTTVAKTEIAARLARRIYSRLDEQGYKGKTADKMALEMWLGAATLVEELGLIELRDHLLLIAAMIISVRGVRGLHEFVTKDADKKAA